MSAVTVEFPSGALALTSPFYVDRPPLETRCTQNIQVPGSLTRIKGPRHIGKSSLLVRLLAQAQANGYRTALIDFQAADADVYTDISRFLRWFCIAIARQLNLPSQLDDYWEDEVGAKMSATAYVENYLLEAINEPIVLALNEVNRVFEHPDIARDFLPLLRFWFEQAKHTPAFRQLRTVVVHSTDIYVSLNIHQSPFNIGLPIQLLPFNAQQVQQLEARYALSLSESNRQALMQLVGGHPYLLSIAFYNLSQNHLSIAQLIKAAPTTEGIYAHHLQSYAHLLQQNHHLFKSLLKVLASAQPVEISVAHAHQLASLGLVTLEGNACRGACELYRLFFTQHSLLCNPIFDPSSERFRALQAENQQLKMLANLDALTQIPNRRFFDTQLQQLYQKAAVEGSQLAIIMIDIDYFKLYNDTYGHIAGDLCLQRVAKTIQQQIRRSSDVVARYGGEEFSVVLFRATLTDAIQTAQMIRDRVYQLFITHSAAKGTEKIVTISLGVACIAPDSQHSAKQLLNKADNALYVAKQKGRNQVAAN